MTLVFPYADANTDVLLLYQATGKSTPVYEFTSETTPTLSQVQAMIQAAAGYVHQRITSAGYCNPLAPPEGEVSFDPPTEYLVKYLVALVASGMITGYHVPGDRGPRVSGAWAQAERIMDQIAQASLLLNLCYRDGTKVAQVTGSSDIPVWSEVVAGDTLSITAYGLYRIATEGSVDGAIYL